MPNELGRNPVNAEPYRDFLEKEMTIMGILSAFCVLTVAGVANALKDANTGGVTLASSVWRGGRAFIVCGCFCLMIAALFFYRQRSLAARYYGEIAKSERGGSDRPLRDLVSEADGWATWRWYEAAFAALIAGFTEFCFGLLATKYTWISGSRIVLLAPIAVAVIFSVTMRKVLKIYNSEWSAWGKFWERIKHGGGHTPNGQKVGTR
jgi:hypothetical protein